MKSNILSDNRDIKRQYKNQRKILYIFKILSEHEKRNKRMLILVRLVWEISINLEKFIEMMKKYQVKRILQIAEDKFIMRKIVFWKEKEKNNMTLKIL